MTAAQLITSADTVTQTLLETESVSPTQMQHLCIVAAAKLGWEYMLTQHADTRRTGHTTYLILSAVAPGFLSDLQRGRQDKWLHATCYNTLRVVYLDKQTQMWILVQYEQQTQDLWNETQIGQPSSTIMTLCQTWIGPQFKARESELNETWSTYTPSLDTVSDPVNTALFTWGSMWSHSDRTVGGAKGFFRLIACALLQKVDCPVQQFFSELGENSAQTHWMSRIRTDSKGNKKVKHFDLKQQTVRLFLPPANVQRSFRQGLTSDTVLVKTLGTGNTTIMLQTLLIGLVHHLPYPDNRELSAKTSAR